jgi:hypothetical protein
MAFDAKRVRLAELKVIRAAMACLSADGFMFQIRNEGDKLTNYVLKPEKMRRLEDALATLKLEKRRK